MLTSKNQRFPESGAYFVDTDLFAHRAQSYDQNKNRVDNVAQIADSIIQSTQLHKSMHLMDFGSGTGLLLERIAPAVGKITAVDISSAMNGQLASKRASLGCDLDIRAINLEHEILEMKFDGIISSMTMHHVEHIGAMFRKFHTLLHEGGFIAIADLDAEDGSFHTENSGVFHCGFARDHIADLARSAGFQQVSVCDASVVHKPQGDFPVFLLKAVR
jgi:cyclopropane fatty-acyl-phospholipid synthase-like methyltransferase